MIGTKITLDAVEIIIAEYLAKIRIENAGKTNFHRGKMSNLNDLTMNHEGMMSEFAFCKLFNIFPDLNVTPRRSKDDMGDCVLHSKRIDVKSTKYPNGKLLVTSWNHCNSDAFALMTGANGTYTFKGFVQTEDIVNPSTLIDLGYGKTYHTKQSDLINYKEFFKTKFNLDV